MKQASFLDTVKTVLWGMIGIRRRADHERANVRPVHVIVLGFIFLILFILTLRFVVSLVVS
ncbi:MAG TPA: DUF2970 domain-containing protein [Burkholderiales bacterium]|nr:DUF2970 domain-containing protein [Burkholderiales bacterium]